MHFFSLSLSLSLSRYPFKTIGMFVTLFSLVYLISPKYCHRFVGYLEEEAVRTYTHCLEVGICIQLFCCIIVLAWYWAPIACYFQLSCNRLHSQTKNQHQLRLLVSCKMSHWHYIVQNPLSLLTPVYIIIFLLYKYM